MNVLALPLNRACLVPWDWDLDARSDGPLAFFGLVWSGSPTAHSAAVILQTESQAREVTWSL